MARILIVDDTAVDRRLAGGLLESAGHAEVEYAENGLQALDRIAAQPPDLVVTDLQMPELSGLQLVEQIRLHYPNIPVILMTARGSEAIAVEALERGAASYVPKSHLSRRLPQTVDDLLGLVRADRSYTHLAQCQTRMELEYELENDPQLIDALVDMLQQMLRGMQLTDETGTFRVGVALREALFNALYHGNLQLTAEDLQAASEQLLQRGTDTISQRRSEPFCRDRRIRVRVQMDRQEARFVIEDDGDGFDYAAQLASINPAADPLGKSESGRGFVLMLALMDEVSFNENGNCVTLIKHREAVAQP